MLRFEMRGDVVIEHLTDLVWSRNANLAEFPVCREEAFAYVAGMNERNAMGRHDWRVPTRRELRT